MENDKTNGEMSFWEHLEELRWILVRSTLGILISTVIAFVFFRFIFDGLLFAPMQPTFFTNRLLCQMGEWLNSSVLCINQNRLEIINISLSGQFTIHLMVSLYTGIILSFPYIIFNLWQFVKPALYPGERRITLRVVFWVSLLFFVGVLFGYYIITPLTIHFLGSYSVSSEVSNTISLNSYIGSITSVTLASGILFELPLVILFLTKTGVVTPALLKKYRKHSFIAIMVLAAIITPPDIISLVLVVIPLWLLFEVSLGLSSRLYSNRETAT